MVDRLRLLNGWAVCLEAAQKVALLSSVGTTNDATRVYGCKQS